MHNRALNEREIIKNPYRFLYSIHDFGIKQNLLKASPAPWAVMSQNADLHIKKLYLSQGEPMNCQQMCPSG